MALASSRSDDNAPIAAEHGVLRLGDSLRARRGRPGVGAITTSVVVHALALAAFVFSGLGHRREGVKYQTIAIHLVSPPPTVAGPPAPVQTTSAVVLAPTPVTKKIPTPQPKPKPQTQSALDTKVVSKPTKAKPATGAHPKVGPVGGEGLNIVQEGVAFQYPEYTDNVIRKLIQYFRWESAANLSANVEFFIKRDGSVGGVELKQSSGNMSFDLAATGAVENAGRQKAFGPLPAGFKESRLKISFTFAPNN